LRRRSVAGIGEGDSIPAWLKGLNVVILASIALDGGYQLAHHNCRGEKLAGLLNTIIKTKISALQLKRRKIRGLLISGDLNEPLVWAC
jgi:hypothetical protein